MLLSHRARCQIIEMASRVGRHSPISIARILGDPLAIGMIAERIDSIRRQMAADLRITNDARGERDMQVEQVAGRAAIQHETGIDDGRLMLGRGLDVLR